MLLEHLALAERHVGEGKRRILHQRELIITLMEQGHPIGDAQALLSQLLEMQGLHEADRARLRKKLQSDEPSRASEDDHEQSRL